MSRVGKKPIVIPSGVTVALADGQVTVHGPKGVLSFRLHPRVRVTREGDALTVRVADPGNPRQAALWGTSRTVVSNLVEGVTHGYGKRLEISGIGFKAAVTGTALTLHVGYSHPVEYRIPAGVTVTVEKNVLTVVGIDKQLVGEVAAHIRSIAPAEPYKGKGIMYVGEVIRRKAGKLATKTE